MATFFDLISRDTINELNNYIEPKYEISHGTRTVTYDYDRSWERTVTLQKETFKIISPETTFEIIYYFELNSYTYTYLKEFLEKVDQNRNSRLSLDDHSELSWSVEKQELTVYSSSCFTVRGRIVPHILRWLRSIYMNRSKEKHK